MVSSDIGYPGNNGIVNTRLGSRCGSPDIIHEIGHGVGLNHEHTRCDRERFIDVFPGRANPDDAQWFNRTCSNGAQLSVYDGLSIMHYPRWAFALRQQDCNNGDDTACTILPVAGAGFNKHTMGNSTALTSRDTAGIFNYYRDQEPCAGNPGGCTWRGFGNVTTTHGGSYDFTLTSSDTRYMVIMGNQMQVAAGLNKRLSNGTYQNLMYKIIPTDGYYKFNSGNLPPGIYRWYVHAASGSGSVDMFPIN